jgi:hypothetical protein
MLMGSAGRGVGAGVGRGVGRGEVLRGGRGTGVMGRGAVGAGVRRGSDRGDVGDGVVKAPKPKSDDIYDRGHSPKD